ncbi:mitochondrial carrier domain-containing protein [Kockiozyma suomiensis]|uniref:mitochondrial carrier domain-containing protein n=1 Tax=Kockiozyma suomiensis TaxID=1337062 RepID=UPI00334383F1
MMSTLSAEQKRAEQPRPQRQTLQGMLPVEAISGFMAGCAATLIVHPLDLVKVRLQLDNSSRSHMGGILHIVNDLRQSKHPLQEAYRGLIPNIVGNTASWAAYFFWYEKIKEKVQKVSGRQDLGFADYLVSSGLAGGMTSLFTNPIWVVKTRMLSTNSQYTNAYTGMFQGLRLIKKEEGIRGFYRGFVPSLLGVGHGAVQIMFYEEMKKWYSHRNLGVTQLKHDEANNESSNLSTLQYITFSATSKIGASLVMYPAQVIRARLQQYNADNEYLSMRNVISRTAKEEGILGFYKGLIPNLFRVVPATCVTFVVYEHTRSYLNYAEI